jgi:hypothetical protein
MEVQFEASVILGLDSDNKNVSDVLVGLSVSDNLDKSKYLDSDDLATEVGALVVTQVLVQGLIGNIHYAHNKKYRDSAEHLRFIISELERGFVAQVNILKPERREDFKK